LEQAIAAPPAGCLDDDTSPHLRSRVLPINLDYALHVPGARLCVRASRASKELSVGEITVIVN
jgi:hypothetical protein